MQTVLITFIKNDFDKNLAAIFAKEGYEVFTNETADKLLEINARIDIYIDTSDERSASDNFNVRTGINDQVIRDLYDANVIRPMSLLEEFFPLLESGKGKRLCWISSAEASINETRGIDGYGYKMAKAALHNFLQITRNALAPKGYTIRVFDPCLHYMGEENMDSQFPSLTALSAARAAFNYFTRRRGIERGDPQRDDEGNIMLRDAYGRQHSW
jgi:NAD(P)-dependent dehydrogenase (short-subunit alcohol dehydrogenase family)